MSTAYIDFISTLTGLREEGAGLSAISGVAVKPRSAPCLRLNGLTVVAFAALEDFLRRRAYEIVSWLGSRGVTFDSLPHSLQTAILVGTLKGLHYSLDKMEKSDRDVMIQLEALLLSQAGENSAFMPSKYFFGRSASNISNSALNELLQAFGYTDVDGAMNEVARRLSFQHIGRVMEQFSSLARNRHSSAHTFPQDYRHTDFLSDVNIRLPLVAVCFDTCLSQLAILVQKNFKDGINHSFAQKDFLEKTALIRVAEWSHEKKGWDEFMNAKQVKFSSKKNFQSRLIKFRDGSLGKDNTIIVKDERGFICDWIQPIP